MRKFVLGASVALTAALSVTLALTEKVDARPIESGSPFLISQDTPEAGSNEILTPETLEPITEAADYYAFVDSFDGQTLYVRLPDGTTQPFTLPQGVGGDDYNLNPGDLVALNADKDNVISGLDNPVVDTEFIGNVESYDGAQLVAKSVTGETINTPVSEAVASRLDLQPGDEVKVTSFQNIEGMTSVCKVKRQEAFVPPEPEPEPPVTFTPAPAPVTEPVMGFW